MWAESKWFPFQAQSKALSIYEFSWDNVALHLPCAQVELESRNSTLFLG